MTAVLSAVDNYEAYAQAKADGCFLAVELECAAWDNYFPTVELKVEALEREFPAEFPDVWEPIAMTITLLSESPIAIVSLIVIRSDAENRGSPVPTSLSSGSGQDGPILRSTRLPALATESSGANRNPITRSTTPARQEAARQSSSSSYTLSSPSSPSVVFPTKANTGVENIDHSTELTIPKPSSVSQPRTASSNPIQRLQSVVITAPSATENSQLVNEGIEMSRSSPPGTSTTSSNFALIQHLESVVTPAAT